MAAGCRSRSVDMPIGAPPAPRPAAILSARSAPLGNDLSVSGGVTFLFGTVENEMEVWHRFAEVGCLVADDDTLGHRIAARTNNLFGKHPSDLDLILSWNRDAATRYSALGATIIDAMRPLDEVASDILELGMHDAALDYAPIGAARVPAIFGMSSARSEWRSENHHGRARMWPWMMVS